MRHESLLSRPGKRPIKIKDLNKKENSLFVRKRKQAVIFSFWIKL